MIVVVEVVVERLFAPFVYGEGDADRGCALEEVGPESAVLHSESKLVRSREISGGIGRTSPLIPSCLTIEKTAASAEIRLVPLANKREERAAERTIPRARVLVAQCLTLQSDHLHPPS